MHTNLKFKRDNPWITYRLKAEEEIREEEAAEAAEANEGRLVPLRVRAMPRTTTIPACSMKAKPLPRSKPSRKAPRSDRRSDPDVPHTDGHHSAADAEEEIRLAKKIETTRMIFRRKVLECDYAARQAVEILQQVHNGDLPFDRTMRISTAEEPPRRRSPSGSR